MSAVRWLATGQLSALPDDVRQRLVDRVMDRPAIQHVVAAIIARVRRDGDSALRALALELDRVRLDSLEVTRVQMNAAVDRVDGRVRRALERAAQNIAAVHRAFRPQATEFTTVDGVIVGRRPDSLDRVGVYAPGGRAAYPSSVLMGVVPAREAGVREIIVCSPPESTGAPSDIVLAAAQIGGAHRVFALGGAGAVAAMAFGTSTVPRVDRIVGPGNAYVAEAKLAVTDVVGIDSPAGPSELFIIADSHADPDQIAREALAQAEHDPLAAVVIVTTDADCAARIARAIDSRIDAEPRAAVISEALAARGGLLVAGDIGEAVAFAAAYAPEHLLLAVADADRWLPVVRNAGTVFVGTTSSVAFGDYLTGANHVLPTGGLARVYSGLSTSDFVRWTSYQRVDRRAAGRLAEDAEILALAERLPAHAAAARYWRGT